MAPLFDWSKKRVGCEALSIIWLDAHVLHASCLFWKLSLIMLDQCRATAMNLLEAKTGTTRRPATSSWIQDFDGACWSHAMLPNSRISGRVPHLCQGAHSTADVAHAFASGPQIADATVSVTVILPFRVATKKQKDEGSWSVIAMQAKSIRWLTDQGFS